MKILRWIDANFEKVILCIFLAIISIVMFLQIILRNIFSFSLTWGDELARYLFIWTAAIGVSFATKNNSHLRMDLFSTLSPKLNRVLSIICDISLGIIAVMLIRSSMPFFKTLTRTNQLSASLQLPMKYIYASMLCGFSLTLLRLIQRYVILIAGFVRKSGKQEKEQGK